MGASFKGDNCQATVCGRQRRRSLRLRHQHRRRRSLRRRVIWILAKRLRRRQDRPSREAAGLCGTSPEKTKFLHKESKIQGIQVPEVLWPLPCCKDVCRTTQEPTMSTGLHLSLSKLRTDSTVTDSQSDSDFTSDAAGSQPVPGD